MRIINKFGGEIIGNPRLVKLTVKQLKEQLKTNQMPVVVVSALAGVTDKLVKLSKGYAQKIIKELVQQHYDWAVRLKVNSQGLKSEVQNLKQGLENDLKELRGAKNKLALQDRILSYGEKWSSLLFAELLNKEGIRAMRLTGEDLGVITDENYGDANIIYKESFKNIKSRLKNFSGVPVITGFIGKTGRGETTTLGRGGSDTTACLIGSVFNPSKVILWKNVPGVLSADPKIVKNVKTIKYLTYGEAEESGKVIHNKAISLLMGKNVALEVAYIADPAKKTIVDNDALSEKGVKIISSKGNLQLFIVSGEKITKPGALFEISGIISKEGINMVLIRNTKESLYVVVEKNSHNLTNARKKIEGLGYHVSAKEVSMVNAVGSMGWKAVEKFNHLLYYVCPEADLGAFPYKGCHRLEAIIEIPKPSKTTSARLRRNRPDEVGTAEVALLGKVKKLINTFHKEFIEKYEYKKNSPR